MNTLHWAHPFYLKFLPAALLLLAGFWYLGMRLRIQSRNQYADAHLARRFMRGFSPLTEALQLAAWAGVLSLLLVTAAGPMKLDVPENVPAGKLEVVLVTDTSDSMLSEDYRPFMPTKNGQSGDSVAGAFGGRLEVAKKVCCDQLMPDIEGNQMGVVIFSGDGRPYWELTHDYSNIRYIFANWLKAGEGPGFGSNVAEGLGEAVKMFAREDEYRKLHHQEVPGMEKVIIVFSDGGFTSEPKEMSQVTQEIARLGIHVIVVGVGLREAKPIPLYYNGQFQGYKSVGGNPNQLKTSSLDEPSLQKLAADTAGEYQAVGSDLKLNIKWSHTLPNTRPEPRKSPLFQYPLAAAMLLLGGISVWGLLRQRDVI